jgi:hypothetical protein
MLLFCFVQARIIILVLDYSRPGTDVHIYIKANSELQIFAMWIVPDSNTTTASRRYCLHLQLNSQSQKVHRQMQSHWRHKKDSNADVVHASIEAFSRSACGFWVDLEAQLRNFVSSTAIPAGAAQRQHENQPAVKALRSWLSRVSSRHLSAEAG